MRESVVVFCSKGRCRHTHETMKNILGTVSVIILATILVPEFPNGAHADTCASAPVVARGEESRFEWSAKAKTRANWRAKVRAMTTLGPDYANWGRAQDTEERCMTGPKGTVCIFTGTPCRR
ncbi:conserved protein of unknown function [Hyphomicrobium sp. MC1]|nr:conserved protein of unknown function [Hyphomicrobium sp. MC1]